MRFLSVRYIEFWDFWANNTTEIKIKDFFSHDTSKQYKLKHLKSQGTSNVTLLLFFERHLLHIFNKLIKDHIPKWSLPLTSMKFFNSSSFFNASVAVIFLFSFSSVTIYSSKFLQSTNHYIRVEVTGKKVKCIVGLRLEYMQTIFYGDARVTTWVKISLEKLDNELHVKVNVSNKNMHEFSFFPTNHRVFAVRGKFCPKCSSGAQKMSAVTNVRYKSDRYIEVFL